MGEAQKPVLVIVGGSPASGKSSLAEKLGEALGLPVLSRDAFKEPLMDQLVMPDGEGPRTVGGAAYALLYVVLDKLIGAGVGAIAESNFTHGEAEGDLHPLTAWTRGVQLVCETVPDEATRRYKQRARSGERHPGHQGADPATLEDLDESIEEGRYDPLDLPIPLLQIDSTNGFSPNLEEIEAFVRNETGRQP